MLHLFVSLFDQFVAILPLPLFCYIANMAKQIDAIVFKFHIERSILLCLEELLGCLVAASRIGKEEEIVGKIFCVWASINNRDVPL